MRGGRLIQFIKTPQNQIQIGSDYYFMSDYIPPWGCIVDFTLTNLVELTLPSLVELTLPSLVELTLPSLVELSPQGRENSDDQHSNHSCLGCIVDLTITTLVELTLPSLLELGRPLSSPSPPSLSSPLKVVKTATTSIPIIPVWRHTSFLIKQG